MRLPTGQRREIIEDLLDIQMFSVMNVLLKDRISTNRTELQQCKYEMDTLATQIEMLNKHLESLQRNKSELVGQKKELLEEQEKKKNELTAAMIEAREKQSLLLKDITDAKVVSEKEAKIRTMLVKIQTRVERLVKDIKFYTENDSCPTCKQGIAHDHKNTIINTDSEQMDECTEGLQQLNQKLNDILARQEQIQETRTAILHLHQEEESVKIKIRFAEDAIKQLSDEITSLKDDGADIAPVQADLKEKKSSLKANVKHYQDLGEMKQVYEIASVLLKDTGIKTKIIKQYIPVINKLINKYLAAMDFFVNFELNESFEEIIKSRHRDEFTYASFSEGEKARLDIAILFTWRAIAKLRNSASTNLLILDEVFDGSLDAVGNDELLTIITDLASEANIFVISHRSEGMTDKFERTLRFEKSKNFSEVSTA
jgi:chromosome segregation ATPase